MRALLFIGLLLAWCPLWAQTVSLKVHVIDKDSLKYSLHLKLSLIQNDSVIKHPRVDKHGDYIFTDVPAGSYSLQLEELGTRTRNISLNFTRDTLLTFNYPLPCEYVYVKGVKPKCVGGHTNNIIPIAYGLPSKKTMRKAKKGKIHLAGCVVTDCDPMYYCTVHKREL
ncbi:MAG: hypothetical protein EOP46_15350 [Sphingobacteriaceae bacterium]|nr:MAG: hypothetical protein EOP46_15350 [Sphingobacteriaceae bacterium]